MDRKGRNKRGRNPWQYAEHLWLYTDLLQTLKGERLSSVFSPAGTLISGSAALHCGVQVKSPPKVKSWKKGGGGEGDKILRQITVLSALLDHTSACQFILAYHVSVIKGRVTGRVNKQTNKQNTRAKSRVSYIHGRIV